MNHLVYLSKKPYEIGTRIIPILIWKPGRSDEVTCLRQLTITRVGILACFKMLEKEEQIKA